MINRDVFYEGYRKYFGKITDEQFADLEFILKKLDESKKITGETWEIVRCKYAYVLATIYWETAQTFDPITERGTKRYLMSKPYYPHVGRGYVQLTWLANYKKFGDFLGVDLVGKPWLANEPEIAWLILEEGMTRNWDVKDPNFTAFTLEDCFNEREMNPIKARRIINGTDKAKTIADIFFKFHNIIEFNE